MGNISPIDLTEKCLERIKKLNSDLNAFITLLEDDAIRQANNAEREIKAGKYKGPLHGIPVSLKDLIYVQGVRSTSGSKILSDFVPDHNSTVVRKLKESGAIIMGTNNTHEFACGITNVNPYYGSSKNPWDTTRMSGGSSGGSAVAVSVGMVASSIGTDTSGSIRVPSSLCGVFGLKPTYGRVSKYGVMPLAPSIDHVGPIARSAWDLAALMQVISGHDILDSSTIDVPVPDYVGLLPELRGRRLGIPKPYFFEIIDQRVSTVFEQFVDDITSCGVSVSYVNVERTDMILDTWRAIRLGESAAVHYDWMLSRPNDYGEDVKLMLEKGGTITAVQYIKAQKVRYEIKDAFLNAMSGFDALLLPTTPITAPKLDEKKVSISGREEIEVYSALSRLTIAFDVTEMPALNVPAGFSKDSLPVGIQLIGRPFDEAILLAIAHMYEKHFKIPDKMIPPICGNL